MEGDVGRRGEVVRGGGGCWEEGGGSERWRGMLGGGER